LKIENRIQRALKSEYHPHGCVKNPSARQI
jgi:hypothetical protein